MSQLFRDMFWLNHGGEVDPSDLPSFVSWLRLRLNVTTARTLYDLDLPIRSRRLAELLGAGSLVDTVEAITNDPTEILNVVGLYLDPPANAVVLSVDGRHRSRRWIALSLCCRFVLDSPRVVRMTTSDMGRQVCMPPSTSPAARFSDASPSTIAPRVPRLPAPDRSGNRP